MNAARSLLSAMNMPQHFWAEAVRHAVYVLNRLPTKLLKDQTPYEVLKGRKPNLSHLRVFGYTGHVKLPANHLKKLDFRSAPMVHLGIETGTKGYRMYDVKGRRLVISRDVTFEESRPWNWWEFQTDAQGVREKEGEFVIHMHPTHSVDETASTSQTEPMTENLPQGDTASSQE